MKNDPKLVYGAFQTPTTAHVKRLPELPVLRLPSSSILPKSSSFSWITSALPRNPLNLVIEEISTLKSRVKIPF